MTVRSMTGYGAAVVDIPLEEGLVQRYRVVLRSVNHRFLDIKLRLSRDMLALEPLFTAAIKKRLLRGHIEGFLEAEPGAASKSTVSVDDGLATELYTAAERLRETLAVAAPIRMSDVVRFPDVITVRRRRVDPAEHSEAFVVGLNGALDAMIEMRDTEGQALLVDLTARVESLRAAAGQISAAASTIVEAQRARLVKRLGILLDDPKKVDTGRVEQELAILADKSDVSEELTRLSSHLSQFTEELGRDPGRGKKLEFITQELLREVNTIGSKVGKADITSVVIDAKCELEKVREQVANLE